MKLFYWIRYNLGKVVFILLIVWALIVGIRKFIPSLDSRKYNKSRPSSIDFRPKKEGNFNSYKRRPRKKLRKLSRRKKLKTKTYVDPETEDQFTISDKTQAMLIEMKNELNEYGVQMEDLLMAIEVYYDNQKGKKKTAPTKNDLIQLLPSSLKELIPEKKSKKKIAEDKKKDKKAKAKDARTLGTGYEPNEIINDETDEASPEKEPADEAQDEGNQIDEDRNEQELEEEERRDQELAEEEREEEEENN